MWPYFSNVLIAGNVGIMVFSTVAVAPTIFFGVAARVVGSLCAQVFPQVFLFFGTPHSRSLAGRKYTNPPSQPLAAKGSPRCLTGQAPLA